MDKHWLIFGVHEGRRAVVGCQCGFQADVESDCGYGDSVVDHLLTAGRQLATSETQATR
jgi:hypothetical protein